MLPLVLIFILVVDPLLQSLLFNWTSHTNGNVAMNPPRLEEPLECVSKFRFWNDRRNTRSFMNLLTSSEFEYSNLVEYNPNATIEMLSTGCFRYCICAQDTPRCKQPCKEVVISGWDMKY